MPMLFGSGKLQELLLDVARNGEARASRRFEFQRRLEAVGICKIRRDGGDDVLTLNAAHPAAAEIRAVLSDLADVAVEIGEQSDRTVHPTTPLGHSRHVPFRLMLAIAREVEGLDDETLRRRMPDIWPISVSDGLKTLVNEGVLVAGEGLETAARF